VKPRECIACGGTDLYQADAASSDGIALRPSRSFWIGPFRRVVARFSVCLSCGFVNPYIGDSDIAVIRGWKENEKKKRDAEGRVDRR
jgi:hypothetical protein